MKTRLQRTFEPALISSVIIGLALANIWHVITAKLSQPPGTVFVGITHYYEDYFYYLSQLTQGALGAWLTSNLYTTEPVPATLLWWPNLVLGKAAALTGLPPWTVYDAAVFTASVASLALLYFGARMLYPDRRALRIGTFLMATLTTCYYLIQRKPDGTLFLNPYQYFYNYTESLNRLGGVFHLILQNILSLGFILAAGSLLTRLTAAKGTRDTVLKKAAQTGLTAAVLAGINPLYIFVNGVSLGLTGFVQMLIRPSRRLFTRLILSTVVIGVFVALPALITVEAFNHPFYRYFRWWENQIIPTNIIIFLHSVGLPVLLIPLGIIPFLWNRSPLRILGIIWTLVPVILYFTPVPRLLEVPYFRLHQPPSYLFIGAVSAEGIYLVGRILTKLTRRQLTLPVFTILLLTYLAFQFPWIRQEVAARRTNYALASWLNYIPEDIYSGLMELKRYPRDRAVLAFNIVELVVPAVTGHTVYQGHHTLTPDYAGKIAIATKFFNAGMSPAEAQNFLTGNNIGYVLWRVRDGTPPIIESYPFLTKRFENSGIIIYILST